MNNLHPIFADCCQTDGSIHSKYATDKPWIFDGHIYATNGRVAVRMPVSGHNNEGVFPPVKDLDWTTTRFSEESFFAPNPGPAIVNPVCVECKGKGKVETITCPDCKGDGTQECDLGHEHDCENCEGIGTLRDAGTCEYCEGSGIGQPSYFPVHIAKNCQIRDDFARILYRHGAKLYLQKVPTPHSQIRFVIDGGIEGLAMPYIPPEDRSRCLK